MKTAKRVLQAALISAIVAIALSLAVACTNVIKDTLGASNWGLVGNWTNPAYSNAASASPVYCYLLTLNADGTYQASVPSMGMTYSGNYSIGDVSMTGNARYYQVYFSYSTSPLLTLVRITNGTTYEVQYSNTLPYPTVITPGSMYYSSFTRQ